MLRFRSIFSGLLLCIWLAMMPLVQAETSATPGNNPPTAPSASGAAAVATPGNNPPTAPSASGTAAIVPPGNNPPTAPSASGAAAVAPPGNNPSTATPAPAVATTPLRFADLVAGKQYIQIPNPPPFTGTKPQVLEIFNFKCPHCYQLHPVFEAWADKNRERFDIQSLPIVFDPQPDRPVRAYFTGLLLGKGKEMKHLIFKSGFTDKMDIENPEVLTFLAEEAGLKADQFKAQLNSFGVIAKVSQAKSLAQTFGIRGTPSVVVNGRYVVQGPHGQGDWQRVMAIVETLTGH
ncbi:MAG: DsbA family protein [Magnetococcales bacterium]|nr:DsbA family protein [Magnetococcales bacterium]